MSRLQVRSDVTGGGDRVYLDTIGDVRSLRYSTSYPGGDTLATWTMALDPTMSHRALFPGRLVEIPIAGGSTWRGKMTVPQRGDPWTFQAIGRAADGKQFVAYAPTSNNALALNEVLDGAISRGIGWTRPASMPAVTAGQQDSGSINVDDALAQVMQAKNKYWVLDRSLAVRAVDAPTTATYTLAASDTAGGRTLDDFTTDVYVSYTNTAGAIKTILRSATSRPFGRFEEKLDITGLGKLALADAQAAGDALLARKGPRLRFTGAFTATPGQLLNPGGVPVDLATVQAGALMRVVLTDPDTAAGELTFGRMQIVVGATDYDVDVDVLTLTPLDTAQRGPTARALLASVR